MSSLAQHLSPAVNAYLAHSQRTVEERLQAPVPTASRAAVVTCVDARIDPWRLLGLARGEATVLRNAGGVITDDVLRSLVVSQRVLGTREIMIIHHTRCGMTTLSEQALAEEIEQETGLRLPFAPEGFADAFAEVRQSLRGLERTAYLADGSVVRGFVHDLDGEELVEVS